MCGAVTLDLEPVWCCLTLWRRGQIFGILLSDCVLDREFLSSKSPWKSQWLWLRLFIIIFLPSELSFTSGRMHRGLNNTLLYVQAVRCDAAYLHQSLTQMMNRRQHLSLSVVGWLVRETLTSCIFSQHNTTFLYVANPYTYLKEHSNDFTHQGQFTCHEEYYSAWELCNVFCGSDGSFSKSEKITPMMSSGLFIYLSLDIGIY